MVLGMCTRMIGEGGAETNFTDDRRSAFIKDVIEPMASNGLRTISIAYRDFPKDQGQWFISSILEGNFR